MLLSICAPTSQVSCTQGCKAPFFTICILVVHHLGQQNLVAGTGKGMSGYQGSCPGSVYKYWSALDKSLDLFCFCFSSHERDFLIQVTWREFRNTAWTDRHYWKLTLHAQFCLQVQKIKAGTKSLCFCLPSSWHLLTKLTTSRSITQSGEHPWVQADSVAQAFIKPQQSAGYKNAYNSTHNHESPGLESLFALGNVH